MSDHRFDVPALLDQLTSALRARLAGQGITDPVMIGIHTGGAWVAKHLHQALGLARPLGTLDISFYRDDFSRVGMHPQVRPSHLPCEVEGKHVVLVDDVLHSGRTVRAALNEIFDYGRPASVMLVALVERSGRELPICADLCALRLDLPAEEHVKLTGPDQLALLVQTHERR
jgi:pyrimidine operon attenuation protein/uracil phosphoribosyltransferase